MATGVTHENVRSKLYPTRRPGVHPCRPLEAYPKRGILPGPADLTQGAGTPFIHGEGATARDDKLCWRSHNSSGGRIPESFTSASSHRKGPRGDRAQQGILATQRGANRGRSNDHPIRPEISSDKALGSGAKNHDADTRTRDPGTSKIRNSQITSHVERNRPSVATDNANIVSGRLANIL